MRKLRGTLAFLLVLGLVLSLGAVSSAAEKKKLYWSTGWSGYPERDALFEQWVARYEAKNPNVDVEIVDAGADPYDIVSTWILGGTQVDVVWMGGGIWSRFDLFVPLNKYVERSPEMVKDVHPAAFSSMTWQGELKGMAFGLMTNVFYYNKNLFNEAGLAYPSKDWTWDEVISKGKQLTKDTDGDGTPDQWGVGMYWPYLMYNYGGDVFSADGKTVNIDRPVTIKAAQIVSDVYSGKNGVQQPGLSASGWTPLMMNNKLAMGNRGPYDIPRYTAQDAFDWDVAAMPAVEDGGKLHRATWMTPEGWSIPITTGDADQAWDFIQFLMDKEQTTEFAALGSVIPTQRSVALNTFAKINPPEHVMAFFDAFDYAYGQYSNHPAWSELRDAMAGDYYQQLKSGDVAASIAIPEIARQAQNILDDWWARQ